MEASLPSLSLDDATTSARHGTHFRRFASAPRRYRFRPPTLSLPPPDAIASAPLSLTPLPSPTPSQAGTLVSRGNLGAIMRDSGMLTRVDRVLELRPGRSTPRRRHNDAARRRASSGLRSHPI